MKRGRGEGVRKEIVGLCVPTGGGGEIGFGCGLGVYVHKPVHHCCWIRLLLACCRKKRYMGTAGEFSCTAVSYDAHGVMIACRLG